MSILSAVSGHPDALKALSPAGLAQLCAEIRQEIISTVSKTGGHLSSNLGIVELTVAIHRVFEIPPDAVIWDVGHQSYVHKLLTGRLDRFPTLRQMGGLSGYPSPAESPADVFLTGHAGTAVSSATGLSCGRTFLNETGRVIAVIGDGSLTNGLTFEGLNFLGACGKDLLVILNDNKMSISPTKGALSYYLTKLITSPIVTRSREDLKELVRRIPSIGEDLARRAADVEQKAKSVVVPGVFFEKLGLRYFGPIDGHDLPHLLAILQNIRGLRGPVLLHTITKKGKGYAYAERRSDDFHGTPPFDPETGEPKDTSGSASGRVGAILEKMAERNPRIVVVTAAMEKGLCLEGYAKRFPERFFDVGIAEGNSVTFSAGLAKAGMRPVVAIYSTFLQRTYDQLAHDICLQGLPAVILVDRAGLAGSDGPTHHGAFDLSFLRTLPGLKVVAPYSLENLESHLTQALAADEAVAIRYPRTGLPETLPPSYGTADNPQAVVLAVGAAATLAFQAAARLSAEGIAVHAVALSGVKPLEEERICRAVAGAPLVVTVEENTVVGGFGSAVLELFAHKGVFPRTRLLGLPDAFVEHGTRDELLALCGLDPSGISSAVRAALTR